MIEIVTQYLVYVGAIGFPTFFALRWVYSQWWKANLPAFWAWVLQQRRRDMAIRQTREKIADLDQRMNTLEKEREKEKEAEGSDKDAEVLADLLNRIGNCERLIARLRHRLRSKGILIDG